MRDERRTAVLDVAHLDQFRSQPARLRLLVQSFLTGADDVLREMSSGLEHPDDGDLKSLLHTLTSMALSTGALALAETCKRLGSEWERNPPIAPAALELLMSDYVDARELLERFLEGLPVGALEAPTFEGRSPTLLLVEDNLATRALVRLVLGDRYTLLEAADGGEALELTERQPPDLVIVDLNLGHRKSRSPSGLSLLHRLKNRIPTLVLTVDQRFESVQRASEAGAWGYLVKSPDLHSLGPTVEMLLARSQEIQEAGNANVIAVATGWLMATYRVDQEVASQILSGFAAKQRCRTVDLARDLLGSQQFFNSLGRYIASQLHAAFDPSA